MTLKEYLLESGIDLEEKDGAITVGGWLDLSGTGITSKEREKVKKPQNMVEFKLSVQAKLSWQNGRAEWSPYPLERTLNNIKRCNEQNAYGYYEICEDEDMRKLIPLTLSNRQRTLNDIYDKLKEVSDELDGVEDNMIAARNVIEDMQEQIDKYMKEYVKEKE